MLLNRGFAVTILIVSGAAHRAALGFPASLHGGRARFPFAADRRVPLQGHHFKHRASGAQMSPDHRVSRPGGERFRRTAPPERRPDVVTRAHSESSPADASTPSGLAPEEQEPVTWLQHPPIKITT